MLKLTTETGEVYIRASQIVSLERIGGERTQIKAKGEYWVTETPEQILAMPEMVKALNPLYCLPGTTVVAPDQNDAKARGWPWPYTPNWKGN